MEPTNPPVRSKLRKLRKRPRVRFNKPPTHSASLPQIAKKSSFVKSSPSQITISAVKWVKSVSSKAHPKEHKIDTQPLVSGTEDTGDDQSDTTLAEIDDDFLEVKIVNMGVASIPKVAQDVLGASEIIDTVRSPLPTPAACIECVLGASHEVSVEGEDTQVVDPATDPADTKEPENLASAIEDRYSVYSIAHRLYLITYILIPSASILVEEQSEEVIEADTTVLEVSPSVLEVEAPAVVVEVKEEELPVEVVEEECGAPVNESYVSISHGRCHWAHSNLISSIDIEVELPTEVAAPTVEVATTVEIPDLVEADVTVPEVLPSVPEVEAPAAVVEVKEELPIEVAEEECGAPVNELYVLISLKRHLSHWSLISSIDIKEETVDEITAPQEVELPIEVAAPNVEVATSVEIPDVFEADITVPEILPSVPEVGVPTVVIEVEEELPVEVVAEECGALVNESYVLDSLMKHWTGLNFVPSFDVGEVTVIEPSSPQEVELSTETAVPAELAPIATSCISTMGTIVEAQEVAKDHPSVIEEPAVPEVEALAPAIGVKAEEPLGEVKGCGALVDEL